MSTLFTRLRTIAAHFGLCVGLFAVVLFCASMVSSPTIARSQKQVLDVTKLNDFAQINVLFYNPSQWPESCYGKLSGGICGNTVEEKIWSILRQTFDSLHAAAVFGSLAEEGGFQPVKWEYYGYRDWEDTYGGVVDTDTCDFAPGMNWNDLYNGVYDGRYGVGTFGLTSGLSKYLHYINSNEPDLIKYFQDPSNTCYSDGDKLAEKIGQSEVDRLIDLEVNYFIKNWIPEEKGEFYMKKFLGITNLHDAAYYWAHDIEVCAACGYNGGSSALVSRPAKAQEYYDKYEDFTCDSSSGSGAGSKDITLIGDSISVMSEQELKAKFPNSFLDMVGSRSIIGGGFCAGDTGGLDILQTIASGSGSIKTQHWDANSCVNLSVDSGSLKENVVWELGTNLGGATKDNMEKVINTVGGNRKLFLVTPYNDYGPNRSSTEEVAQLYRDLAGEYGNVYIVDWAKAVEGTGYKYVYGEPYMTVHPTDEGKKLLANLIFNAVSNSGASGGLNANNGGSSGLVSGDDIIWIGDSDSSYAGEALLEKTFPGIKNGGWGPSFNDSSSYIQACKFIKIDDGCNFANPSGLKILDRIIKEGKLRKYLVFALGGNGGWGYDEMEIRNNMKEFLDLLKDKDVKIILTTTRYRNVNYVESNDYVRKIAQENPNVYVADVAANYKDEYIDSSGIEFTPEGSKMFVQTIKDAVDAAAAAATGADDYCGDDATTLLSSSGLTEEQAQKVADYYNSSEVTASNFIGGAIPSSCQKMNCVSFSLWFVSAFTDTSEISPTPALVGDGSYIADTGLPGIGWQNGNDPKPFSVFGGAGSGAWKHTGVVVGVADSENVITIEAAYKVDGSDNCIGRNAWVGTRPLSYFASGVGILAYPGQQHFSPDKGHLGNKSLYEIIGN